MNKKNIILAVTGASGSIYADLLLKKMNQLTPQIENAGVIFSLNALSVWDYEMNQKPIETYSFKRYDNNDFYAPVASGSSLFDTMIICPCSMGTLGRIASGISTDLITRAADVILKERKKLILVTREMPLNLIHIKNMKIITEAGGIICPASPSFYSKPSNIEEILDTVILKIMQLASFEIDGFKWGAKK